MLRQKRAINNVMKFYGSRNNAERRRKEGKKNYMYVVERNQKISRVRVKKKGRNCRWYICK